MPIRHPYPSPRPPAVRPRRAGFTLVELLVVIGIILVLAGIILPAVSKAMERANRSRMAFDLQAIVIALEAYRQDHGDIPRTSPDGAEPRKFIGPPPVRVTGAQILCQALIGPGEDAPPGDGDGAKGPGFRTRPPVVAGGAAQGKVYGPYLNPDKFNIGNPDGSDANLRGDETAYRDNRNRAVIVDRQKQPILYYPGLPRANIKADGGYVSAMTFGGTTSNRPMYNAGAGAANPGPGDTPIITRQDGVTGPIISQAAIRLLLGDQNANGKIDGREIAAFTGPYLLMSAGPDEFFGPESDQRPISSGNRCDDILNFDSPGNQ